MPKITPFFWFQNNDAEDALNHYLGIFPNSRIVEQQRMPEGGPAPAGSLLTATFELDGQRFAALNGGPHDSFNDSISMFVLCESQAEVDHYYDSLLVGGQPSQCGWLKDKFGVSWQIIPSALGTYLSDPDPLKAQRVMQAMMQMVKLDVETLTKAYNGEQ